MSDREPAWKRRFTAPQVWFPRWSPEAPTRLVAISNESGSFQAWAFELDTGRRRRATDEPVGVEEVHITPDGRGIVWWHDATGDERGHWVVAPFEGGPPRRLLPGVPDGWTTGLATVPGTVAVGIAGEDDYAVHVSIDGQPARELHRHPQPVGVGQEWPQGSGGISADGSLLCIRRSEHGDLLHSALRVIHAHTGRVAGEQLDPGRNLSPAAWSPVPGDQRLAVLHERAVDFERPAIWNLSTGEREDLELDLPGAAFPVGWWPDASALLLRHEFEGGEQLWRLDLVSRELAMVADPGGEIADAAVRPDGDVWLQTSSSTRPPAIVDADGREVLKPEGEPPPPGRPYRSMWFENPEGQRIQAFVATPPDGGPFPLVMDVHGGPEWHDRDRFDPEVQAYVDHGFAVAMVNYRGSTGYGVAFRNALERNIGFPESEDVLACVDALIAEGTAQPEQVFFAGWSWGGYLACLNAGRSPERWRAIFAGIPTGDYVDAHHNCSPVLRAWDLAVMGGSPEDVPDLYRERNPMTYVSRVTAPVFIIAGENDSRCPLSSATKWMDAAVANGADVQIHTYETGHHANQTDEIVRHMELVLDFFLTHLGNGANRDGPGGH